MASAGSTTSFISSARVTASPVSPSIEPLGKVQLRLVTAYNVLLLLGIIAASTVVLTAFAASSRIRRTGLWYQFMLGWIFLAFSYLLLLGKQTGPPPPFSLCMIQSMLAYAVPVLVSHQTLALLLQLFLRVRASFKQQALAENKKQNIILHVYPWVLFAILFFAILINGLDQPEMIHRSDAAVYCHTYTTAITRTTIALALCAVLPFFVLEMITFVLLYRNWNAFRKLRKRSDQCISIAIFFRISLFSLLPLITAVFALCVLKSPGTAGYPEAYIGPACMPLAAGVIFGTQQDNLQVWAFWKRNPTQPNGAPSFIKKAATFKQAESV